VERVELFDQFTNKKTGRSSQAYRVTYRSMDRSLTNEEVNDIQEKVRDKLVGQFQVELR
jgi:phenylalanyl-tRNA synthetase alpha chain